VCMSIVCVPSKPSKRSHRTRERVGERERWREAEREIILSFLDDGLYGGGVESVHIYYVCVRVGVCGCLCVCTSNKL